MKKFHHLLYIFIVVAYIFVGGAVALLPCSCDRMDDNGRFEGYWHLVEREGSEILANDKADITWGVRNELIQIDDLREKDLYYCTFTRSEHHLQLLSAFKNDGSNDTEIAFSSFPAKFCIPEDGEFEVVELNAHEMKLRSPKGTLRFKKN